jgi:hypothetical protein
MKHGIKGRHKPSSISETLSTLKINGQLYFRTHRFADLLARRKLENLYVGPSPTGPGFWAKLADLTVLLI